jgi:hypothetical protein
MEQPATFWEEVGLLDKLLGGSLQNLFAVSSSTLTVLFFCSMPSTCCSDVFSLKERGMSQAGLPCQWDEFCIIRVIHLTISQGRGLPTLLEKFQSNHNKRGHAVLHHCSSILHDDECCPLSTEYWTPIPIPVPHHHVNQHRRPVSWSQPLSPQQRLWEQVAPPVADDLQLVHTFITPPSPLPTDPPTPDSPSP